jgi:CelD/BcsL family acetyltransferase involved in cellulose biosynthesis
MRCTLIKAAELTPELSAVWSGFQDANPQFRSPALRPELFQIVGRYYSRARIAIFEDERGIAGFLPIARHPVFGSVAGPVPICDYQDAVMRPGWDTSLPDLLKVAGLKTLLFEHLLVPPGPPPEVTVLFTRYSKRIHIASTWDDYLAGLKENGKSMKNILTKLRLLGRDHGEVVFSEDSRDEKVLDPLLDWKAQRFNHGKPVDAWISGALHEIFATRTPEFAGVLGTLYAGDQLVAAHFGMKSGRVLYYWFPAFNPAFSKYTPGWLLVEALLRTAGNLDCDTIDLGPGGEPYKDYFSNVQIPVSGGYIELPGAINLARRSYRAIRNGVRGNRAALSILRPLRQVLRRL